MHRPAIIIAALSAVILNNEISMVQGSPESPPDFGAAVHRVLTDITAPVARTADVEVTYDVVEDQPCIRRRIAVGPPSDSNKDMGQMVADHARNVMVHAVRGLIAVLHRHPQTNGQFPDCETLEKATSTADSSKEIGPVPQTDNSDGESVESGNVPDDSVISDTGKSVDEQSPEEDVEPKNSPLSHEDLVSADNKISPDELEPVNNDGENKAEDDAEIIQINDDGSSESLTKVIEGKPDAVSHQETPKDNGVSDKQKQMVQGDNPGEQVGYQSIDEQMDHIGAQQEALNEELTNGATVEMTLITVETTGILEKHRYWNYIALIGIAMVACMIPLVIYQIIKEPSAGTGRNCRHGCNRADVVRRIAGKYQGRQILTNSESEDAEKQSALGEEDADNKKNQAASVLGSAGGKGADLQFVTTHI